MSLALGTHQMLPQAESPPSCPGPCPTPALCPSSAHSVLLPLLLAEVDSPQPDQLGPQTAKDCAWSCFPTSTSSPALSHLLSALQLVPHAMSAFLHDSPTTAAGQHSQAEGAAGGPSGTPCVPVLPPQPCKSQRCPPLALLAAQLGLKAALSLATSGLPALTPTSGQTSALGKPHDKR